jgi:3-deoxy-D-manno-octulosonic-acid transferase
LIDRHGQTVAARVPAAAVRSGFLLRLYLAATSVLAPFAPRLLRKRVEKGREDPIRFQEKLGVTSGWRPANTPLVWMHAVGLGEVMALRGLITAMQSIRPDLHILVTSSARASAKVFAENCPPQTQHQFLPLDANRFIQPFLNYWKPDLSIWAEQDIWPNLITKSYDRGIPIALVNARIGESSYHQRRKIRSLYRDVLSRLSLISAQDQMTADHLRALGAQAPVQTHPSLKLIAPALAADPAKLRDLRAALKDRSVWMVGPSHFEDEQIALSAHKSVLTQRPDALLVMVPRYPERGAIVAQTARAAGLRVSLRSANSLPDLQDQVFVADSFGEMGLWYRLASAALIGGSFGDVNGHNPWEAARLGAAILHGPRWTNFRDDYAMLGAYRAASECTTPDEIARAVLSDLSAQAARAAACCAEHSAAISDLAQAWGDLIPEAAR